MLTEQVVGGSLNGIGVAGGPRPAPGVCPWGQMYPPLPQQLWCPCLLHPACTVMTWLHTVFAIGQSATPV